MDCMNKKNPPQVVSATYIAILAALGQMYNFLKHIKIRTLFPILNKPFVGCRCDRSR